MGDIVAAAAALTARAFFNVVVVVPLRGYEANGENMGMGRRRRRERRRENINMR